MKARTASPLSAPGGRSSTTICRAGPRARSAPRARARNVRPLPRREAIRDSGAQPRRGLVSSSRPRSAANARAASAASPMHGGISAAANLAIGGPPFEPVRAGHGDVANAEALGQLVERAPAEDRDSAVELAVEGLDQLAQMVADLDRCRIDHEIDQSSVEVEEQRRAIKEGRRWRRQVGHCPRCLVAPGAFGKGRGEGRWRTGAEQSPRVFVGSAVSGKRSENYCVSPKSRRWPKPSRPSSMAGPSGSSGG